MTTPKVALVTGSGKRRVGAHVAEALAGRGYSLVIHYRTSAAEANLAVEAFQKRGVPAIAVQADLTHEKEIHALVDAALAAFGRLDVLVNCAADWKSQRLEDVTAADVRHFFEVNTLGTFLCSVRAGLAMVKQKEGGCIVTVGDWATGRPYLHYAAYLVSKGSVPAMTRTLAVELGSRNPAVRVNCILPGPVMLPKDLPIEEREEAIQGTLVGHEGHPDDVARGVVFLVESPFVTGVALPIDGGRSIFTPEKLARA